MKIAIKRDIININILKDLKSTFDIVYDIEKSEDLYLEGDILYIFHVPVDISHWLRRIESDEDSDLSLSSLIDSLLINLNELDL